ncbi:CocE/NonD family hydrolase [Actinomadura sp. GTD37]|uniref:CocE/NonD family hydrolase n=1 Tax=Actinomadura sp. GTD37 TaxID=1778030 RepID=UPI0035BF0D48
MSSEMLVSLDLMVPMRDGVRLATDVYGMRRDRPGPVILQRIPYGKSSTGIVNNWLDVRRAVEAGFAVAVQDTRGRFASEGTFEPFVAEEADGADTVDWLARQPWCDGRVVMAGGSYTGTTQWSAAAAGPAGLKAIAPATTSADVRDGWARSGGALQLGFVALWMAESLVPSELARRAARGEDVAAARALLAELTASAGGVYAGPPADLAARLLDVAPYAADWLGGDLPDRVPRPDEIYQGEVPVLSIGGWHDIFLDGTLEGHVTASRSASSRLVVGPWAHGAHSGWFPERWFGPRSSAAAVDLGGVQLRWFEEVLDGAEVTGPPVRIFVMGADEWRDEQEWPPVRAEYVPFRLGADAAKGLLTAGERTGPDEVEVIRHDPADPVPATGGATYLPGLFISANSGPRDQRAVEARPDVLSFTSAPLEAPLEAIGPVAARLFVSGDAGPADFVARLVDVEPDGRAMSVCDGILRVDLTGDVREIEVRMSSTAYAFERGHRIRLDVAASCFPRFDLAVPAGSPVREQRLHHGPLHPSCLILPVIPLPTR